MNKVILILFALSLTLTFAAKTSTQGKLQMRNLVDKLNQSNLGRSIVNMMQLGEELGFGYDDLFTAIDELKRSLLEDKEHEEIDFNQATNDYNDKSITTTTFIKKYAADEGLYGSQLYDLSNRLRIYQGALARQQVRKEGFLKEYSSQVQNLQNMEDSYQKTMSDYSEAIRILDLALESLNEAKTNAKDAKFSSFLQTNAQKYFDVTNLLQNNFDFQFVQLEKVLIKPVIEVFVSMSQFDVEDSSIQEAINILLDLKAIFVKGSSDFTITSLKERQAQQDVLDSTKGNLDALAIIIPSTESQIKALKEQVESKQKQIDDARLLQVQLKVSLEELKVAFDKRTAIHKYIMPKYDEEYAIVAQAEMIVKNALRS